MLVCSADHKQLKPTIQVSNVTPAGSPGGPRCSPSCLACSVMLMAECWQVYDPARLRRLDVSMFERLVEGGMPVQQLLVRPCLQTVQMHTVL